MSEFLDGYLEALEFTDMQTGDDCDGCELSDSLRADSERDCELFQERAADLLARAYASGDYDEAQAGRDFWLTRNGHGAGFWDRPQLRSGLGDKLAAVADEFRGVDIYCGDDGLAYGS